jgi:hypothetical protein
VARPSNPVTSGARPSSQGNSISIGPADVAALYRLGETFPGGVTIHLGPGDYVIGQTIYLPSNIAIIGAGKARTRIILAPASHCHLFTNLDHKSGNTGLTFRDFSVEGNGDSQERQPHHKALTFCCAIYMKNTRRVLVEDVDFSDIRQTATHFNGSEGVIVRRSVMRKLGWSGVSTSGTSNLQVDVTVSDAGRDEMHSAIHLDGGIGVHCRADVSATTGNGIMLDSTYSALRNVVVEGSASGCKRGVSLSGSAVKPLEVVLISGKFCDNAEIGVMVSNAQYVTLSGCEITGNGEVGVLFQGRNGGRDCIVFGSEVSGNPEDVKEIHASGGNWVFSGDVAADGLAAINVKNFARPAAVR